MELRGMAVCHECLSMLRRAKRPTQWRFAAPIVGQWSGRSFTTSIPPTQPRRQRSVRYQDTRLQHIRRVTSTPRALADTNPQDLHQLHSRVISLANIALKPDNPEPPSEQRILYILEQLSFLARSLIDARTITTAKQARERSDSESDTATSALLGSVNAKQYPAFLSKASLLNLISTKAEAVLRHPNVFITPSILKSYVELQSLLHQPTSLPSIFTLYATKPLPKLTSSGKITYSPVSPHAPNAAIDSLTANTALTSAIKTHNLPLSISIIQSTFCTPAYKRAKILRQALLPGLTILTAPFLVYALSTQYSTYFQQTMDPGYATQIAFAGIMTYLATVSSLGYVVVTTANDRMDRVTWAKGVPLWERWVREEERAALDRVAGKWGFVERERRGEEEGAEWEALREFVGMRGMVLDRAELMEGME